MVRLIRVLAGMGLLLSARAAGQDIDTVVFPRDRKPFPFLEQIEDKQERADFLALYKEKEAARKRRLAEAFLDAYPRSWVLAQVYEIASKAAIDAGDFPMAVRYGRESLRLFPENPWLLVPLANVQVQQGLFAEAGQNAQDALEYLERFGRPAAIPEKQWPALKRELQGSSHFVLGRIEATEGLAAAGQTRRERVRGAVGHLSRAREFNPEDPEICYLLGLAHLALGEQRAAAAAFAPAYRRAGLLSAKAQEQLRKIYQQGGAGSKGSFEAFLDELASDEPKAAAQQRTERAPDQPDSYAGTQACRQCHARQHAAWGKTGMARMFRPYRPENVLGDFTIPVPFAGETGFPLAQVWIENNRHFFAIRKLDGRLERYRVDYTIGSKWQQAYATELPNGQIHVFPLQYNKLQGRWLNYWKMIDPPGSERTDVRAFHRMSPVTNYQLNCAPCHTSQLRRGKEGVVFREPGINCEMCHGPSARHAAASRSGKSYQRQAWEPPVDFRRLENREYVAICAQCHMQSAMREAGPQGELNYSEAGARFFQSSPSRPYVEFSRKAFYKDGRFRETTFIIESFLRSACFKKGKAHCGSCHDPHPDDAASNSTSLKFSDRPDQMCLQCHAKYASNPEAHTRHAASSEASRCITCHMPRIMNSVLFQARTHQIDDIPAANMTLRFGHEESPNVCLTCHTSEEPKWAKQKLDVW